MLLDKIVVSDIAPANTGVIWIKPVGDNYEQSIFLNGKWVKLDKAEEISGIVSSINNQAPDENGNVNITKENIGLGNVDNTADEDKIVKGASEDGSGNVITTTYETKTDATTKQIALQQAIANLTGLDSTNFGGFSIQSTEADAISNIVTLYTADGYTDELLWYMAGTSLSSVKAYRYNGSGTPTAISSDTYNYVDFSGLIADVSTLSQNLAALGPEIDKNKADIEALQEDVVEVGARAGSYDHIPLLGGQPMILFGSGAPVEANVPDNWIGFDDGGFEWIGTPSMMGQQYIDTTNEEKYVSIKNNFTLSWLKV